MATLYELAGSKVVRAHQLNDGVFWIGRSPECDVVVDDASVSRRHCRAVVTGSLIQVIDDQSANGTSVDGVAVGPARLVPDGGRLRVGKVTFVCRNDPSGLQPPELPNRSVDRGWEIRVWWSFDAEGFRFGWRAGAPSEDWRPLPGSFETC